MQARAKRERGSAKPQARRAAIKEIKGEYQVKNEGIRLLYDSALRWIKLIPRFSISHVRRENNKEADKLANRAMDTRRNSVQWD